MKRQKNTLSLYFSLRIFFFIFRSWITVLQSLLIYLNCRIIFFKLKWSVPCLLRPLCTKIGIESQFQTQKMHFFFLDYKARWRWYGLIREDFSAQISKDSYHGNQVREGKRIIHLNSWITIAQAWKNEEWYSLFQTPIIERFAVIQIRDMMETEPVS